MSIIERDPSLALQKAINSALKVDAVILAQGARVFDRVDVEHYPRIVIGEDRCDPDDTDCYSATDVFSTVRVYTNTVGKVQAKELAERVRFLLTKPSGFTVEGFQMVWGHCTSAKIQKHEDALIHQIPIEFSYRFIPDSA